MNFTPRTPILESEDHDAIVKLALVNKILYGEFPEWVVVLESGYEGYPNYTNYLHIELSYSFYNEDDIPEPRKIRAILDKSGYTRTSMPGEEFTD